MRRGGRAQVDGGAEAGGGGRSTLRADAPLKRLRVMMELEIAQAEIGDHIQGRSLVPLLTGAGAGWRESVLIEFYTYENPMPWLIDHDYRAGRPVANAAVDAATEPDANLSDHGFVQVDGTLLTFETTQTYTNASLGDVTINGQIGPDCPIGANCTTLYVTVPGDATLGYHTCDELLVGVQLSEGSNRFFSFGSANAFCSFDLVSFDTESDGQVAVSNLSARLEADLQPANNRLLSGGELRATTD